LKKTRGIGATTRPILRGPTVCHHQRRCVATMISDREWNANTFLNHWANAARQPSSETRGVSSTRVGRQHRRHRPHARLGIGHQQVGLMGIPSDGQYAASTDTMFGFPVTCRRRRVQSGRRLAIDAFSCVTGQRKSCRGRRVVVPICCSHNARPAPRWALEAMQPPRRVVWRTGDLTSAMGAQSSHPRNVLLGAKR
jgi:hypothetical protein